MKRSLFLFFSTIVTLFATQSIKIVEVPGNLKNVSIDSRAWMSSDFQKVKLYPFALTPSNDRELNSKIKDLNQSEVYIKVLSDKARIAFLVKWKDTSYDLENSSSFADAISISFVKDETGFPFVTQGDKNRPLIELYQKAVGKEYISANRLDILSKYQKEYFEEKDINKYTKIYLKEGLYKKEVAKTDQDSFDMKYLLGNWYALFIEKLNTKYLDINRAKISINISIWDGNLKQRGQYKRVSNWIMMELFPNDEQKKPDLKSDVEISVSKGEELFVQNCTICHRFKNYNKAPLFMAPNLSYIGKYALKDYIRESILKPSNVIVQSFNPDAHPNYPWFEMDDNGERVSAMPSFEWMDEKSIEDILAFLETH